MSGQSEACESQVIEPPSSPELFPLAAAALTLVVRGWVLAGETAVGAVGSEHAEELAESSAGGRALVKLKQDPEQLGAAVRSLMSLALAVTAVSLAEVAISIADTLAPGWPPWVPLAGAAFVAWLITVPSDVLMRSLASAFPERWALHAAPGLVLVRTLLSPMARLVGLGLDLVLRPAGVVVRFSAPPPPLEELERLLVDTREEGAPEPELVRSLFEFGERTVKEIMVPRTDVFAIPHDADPQTIVRLFVEDGHTRVPIYRETLDSIVGVVHVKDVLPLVANPELILLHDLVRPPMFIPWNQPIARVMRELQREGQHLAVVVDEYGGVAGIVTLEDIVEQIVGDIRDEFDEEEAEVRKVSDGTSLVRAEMRISDFNEEFDTTLPEEEGYETLGGFLNTLAGAIPAEGDRFYFDGIEFQVAAREPRRVLEVKVTRTRPDPSTTPSKAQDE